MWKLYSQMQFYFIVHRIVASPCCCTRLSRNCYLSQKKSYLRTLPLQKFIRQRCQSLLWLSYLDIIYSGFYTTVQKVLGRFEVSKDVYVESFKNHVFDPLLSNKTTDYYHEILLRHFLCFKAFQLRHSIRKRSTEKFF